VGCRAVFGKGQALALQFKGFPMGNTREILVFGDSQGVANFAVNKWMEICTKSVRNKGFFTVALSGGRTPIDFYTMLSARGNQLPWEKTHIFLADERFVPSSDKESNYRLIREYLLSHIDIPEANIHPVQTEEITLKQAAERYEDDIGNFFNIQGDRIPVFDLIMLGMGEDGHTASLFPGTPSLEEKRRLTIPVIAVKAPNKRISLTLPVLNKAKHIIFLVSGEDKAPAVKEMLESRDSELPAALVKPEHGSLLLVIDEAAASLLSIVRTEP